MIKNAVTLLHGYAIWVRRLPQSTGLMFTARSPLGRSVKIFLFGVGVVLPLGSLIWVVLFWHGNGIARFRRTEGDGKANRGLAGRLAAPASPVVGTDAIPGEKTEGRP